MKTKVKENTSIKKLAKNAKILKVIEQAIAEKKGEKYLLLDLRKIEEAVADYFIICQASSHIQIQAITEEITRQVKEQCSETPYRRDGKSGQNWIILDYFNVVVHVMRPDIRAFYKLEEMWNE